MSKRTATGVRLAVFGLAFYPFANQPAMAAEYVQAESPPPASAGKVLGPLDWAFRAKPIPERFVWEAAKEALEDAPRFFRDTKFNYDFRTYSFDRRNSSIDQREAWAIGGQLAYESGWWNNIGVRAAYYNSTELDSDGLPTGLLTLRQENIRVIGEANLRYQFTDGMLAGSVIQLYRQTLDLPYINKHDIRMVPASHEGYTIQRDNSSLDYIVGHLAKFKDFDSEDFVHMSEAAGAAGSDQGVTVAGLRYPVNDELTIGAGSWYGWDTFNTFFAEATYHQVLAGDLDFRLSGQFTDQRSVGDKLVGDFDTHHFAAGAAFGWRGAVVKLAGSITSDEARIRKPWGGSPSYVSIQRLDFDRANEKAVLLGLSYNTEFFSSLGLSSYINIAHGTDAEIPLIGADLPDRTEYNLTVDYKPPRGLLKGLWVRARYARLDIDGDDEKVRDIRIIVNYSIPFL
jgi:hypothetical protein